MQFKASNNSSTYPLSFFRSFISHIYLVKFYLDFLSPQFFNLLFGLILFFLLGPSFFVCFSFSWWGLCPFQFIVSFWLCYLIIFAWIFSLFLLLYKHDYILLPIYMFGGWFHILFEFRFNYFIYTFFYLPGK